MMDQKDQARAWTLKRRQARKVRVPAALKAWTELGIAAVALGHERSEVVVTWLRANWREPDEQAGALRPLLEDLAVGLDAVIVLDFWQWDEAVAVLVPSAGLLRIVDRMREIHPDGFLATDPLLTKGLLVDFDDEVRKMGVARIRID